MSQTQDAKKIVESVFAESAKGNGRAFAEALADDCRWTVLGTTSWSKTYEGKAQIVAELFTRLRATLGTVVTVPDRVFADGDLVAVEAHGENTTRAGAPYRNRYCFVIRVADGKLAELREYCDTALIEKVIP